MEYDKKTKGIRNGRPLPDRIMKSLIFQAESYETSSNEAFFN